MNSEGLIADIYLFRFIFAMHAYCVAFRRHGLVTLPE